VSCTCRRLVIRAGCAGVLGFPAADGFGGRAGEGALSAVGELDGDGVLGDVDGHDGMGVAAAQSQFLARRRRRRKITAKGGDTMWITWGTDTARLLPRRIASRKRGPLYPFRAPSWPAPPGPLAPSVFRAPTYQSESDSLVPPCLVPPDA
jgi:hypothetical protein